MTDDETKKQLNDIQESLEVLIKGVADWQLLTIRMMSHQQAHLAALRNLLERMGEDRTMLGQRLRAAFESAVNVYHDQLEAYQQSGDVKKFVNSLVFPDETLGN